jgi:hypothetical protein
MLGTPAAGISIALYTLLMEPIPASEHLDVARRISLLGQLEEGELSAWVILLLALMLFALFVTMLVGRRSLSSIVAYFAASLLPLTAGLFCVAAGAVSAFQHLGTAGIADPAGLPMAMGAVLVSFLMSAGVTFLGLVGTSILAFVGPSKMAPPLHVPQ